MTRSLTTREGQVCDLLVMGMSNKEAARELGISHRTVEDFRNKVLAKYKVPGVVHLIRAVYALGKPPTREVLEQED